MEQDSKNNHKLFLKHSKIPERARILNWVNKKQTKTH